MHGLVIDVRGNGLIEGAPDQQRRVSLRLLLVSDEVLHTSDNTLLHTDDGVVCKGACKIWVVAEAYRKRGVSHLHFDTWSLIPVLTLPVPAHPGDSSDWSYYRSQSHIDTFTLEFCAHVLRSCAGELLVPAGPDVNTGWVPIDAVGTTHAVACIL